MALGPPVPPVALRLTPAMIAVRSLSAGEDQVSAAFSRTDGSFPGSATFVRTVSGR